MIREADGADLVAFPELYLSGYRLDELEPVACRADGAELGAIADVAAAARRAVVIGFVERLDRGFANSVACFDERGNLAGVYRKLRLFGREAAAFRAGESLLVVKIAGRAVAPLICFDLEFPELARAAALAGADLLLSVAANMEPFGREHLVHTAARALENRVPHLYVNRVGRESSFDFVGGSRSVGSDGSVAIEADGRGARLLPVEVGSAGVDDDRIDYLEIIRSTDPPTVRKTP